MRMYGNMTSVEKQMNKEDLMAWKNYDNNQYSMIVGVSSQKKVMDRSSSNPKVSSHYEMGRLVDPRFEAK